MNITNQQLTHPGIFDSSKKRLNQLKRFKEAVKQAKFLLKNEKRNWLLLGYILTASQLLEAERLIINEDLRALKIKQKLERLKPKPSQNV